jgi:hypothetical protein
MFCFNKTNIAKHCYDVKQKKGIWERNHRETVFSPTAGNEREKAEGELARRDSPCTARQATVKFAPARATCLDLLFFP